MMTAPFMNMLWSINFRMGIGLDVESCDSRPVWAVDTDGEIEALSFNGLVLCIPFFVITIGSLWRDD